MPSAPVDEIPPLPGTAAPRAPEPASSVSVPADKRVERERHATAAKRSPCPSCATPNDADAAFCKACGAALAGCPSCGRANDADAAFCKECGAKLAAGVRIAPGELADGLEGAPELADDGPRKGRR
jgi:hypothetical protein